MLFNRSFRGVLCDIHCITKKLDYPLGVMIRTLVNLSSLQDIARLRRRDAVDRIGCRVRIKIYWKTCNYLRLFYATKLRKPSEKARCRWSNQPEGTRLTKKVGTIKNHLLINQFRRKGRRSVKDRIYLFQNLFIPYRLALPGSMPGWPLHIYMMRQFYYLLAEALCEDRSGLIWKFKNQHYIWKRYFLQSCWSRDLFWRRQKVKRFYPM